MHKKGFTLIELLAVILILGIIALIAIPTVNRLLDSSREGAFQATLNEINKTVENKCTIEKIKNTTHTNVYSINNGIFNPSVEIKGDLPDGVINVDDNCEITFELHNNNYIGIKNKTNSDIVIKKNDGKYTYYESILNGAFPILDEGMIPVKINNDGTVIKADLTEPWYSYKNKKWANVVLVNSTKRSYYKNANPGINISEDDILAYLVWIPKYSIKLQNVSGSTDYEPKLFDIKFNDESNGSNDGEYLTLPGFTLGSEKFSGLWYAKFESTKTNNSLTIKPNESIWANLTAYGQFNKSKELTSDTYGLTFESMMSKNNQWSTASYLSYSKYGIGTNIRTNATSTEGTHNLISGCGANNISDKNLNTCDIGYGEVNSYPQSSTGNIYGIFGLSGGAEERVMGILTDDSGNPRSGRTTGYNSEYKGIVADGTYINGYDYPDSKYYQLYNSAMFNSYLGEALVETKGWNNNNYNFIDANNPYIVRGGNIWGENQNGQFTYNANGGGGYTYYNGFRIIVLPR